MRTTKTERTGQSGRTGRRADRRAPLKDLAPNRTKDVTGGSGRYQLRLDEATQLISKNK